MFKLTCLGDFVLFFEQQPVPPLRTDKVRALFVYLALEARPHRRETLAGLLWPEIGEEYALKNLRNSLHRLRQSLAEVAPGLADQLLISNRQSIAINPALLTVDLWRFVELIAGYERHDHAALAQCDRCCERLQQAVDLYQGELLAGFNLPDAPAFEEWLLLRREALHQQWLLALYELTLAYEARCEWDVAQRFARRILGVEPWREETHRILMRLLAKGGQRSAALAQFQVCQKVLREELGVEPDAETSALYEEIRKGKFDKAPASGHNGLALSPPHPVTPSAVHDWGEMPAVDFFAGRTVEMTQLQAWLTPKTDTDAVRLVTILGMGGIGKTTLAAAAVKAVAPRFETLIWRSLLNAPPLAEIVRNWLQILSRQTLTTFPESFDEQLRLLLDYLRQQHCLLVLDNVESILQPSGSSGVAGEVRPGYEAYGQLLQRISTSEHASCLLLTSRELPNALAYISRQSNALRLLPLVGLDVQAGQNILLSNGLSTSTAEAELLVRTYSGNPLVLQIVANTIADLFAGNVALFAREEGFFFDGIRTVLDQQFARLNPLERDLLVWLAIEREAVGVDALRSNLLHPPSSVELLRALHSLQTRSLLEKNDGMFTLQNVIIEYITEYLIEQICREIVDGQWQIADGNRPTDDPPSTIHRSWLNRFALLKAQAKEYVHQSQERLLVQPVAKRLRKSWEQTGMRVQVSHILDTLRGETNRSGYAAGNLLNLLIHLGEDLAAYDFSQLSVWHADLRQVNSTALNFTHADLSHSAFTFFFHVAAVAFQRAGAVMVAGVENGDFALRRAIDAQLISALRLPSNGGHPMCFSADGQLVVSAGRDHLIRVWSTVSGTAVQTLHGHKSTIFSLAISPDHRLLASGTVERTIYLWDVQTGRLLTELDGHEFGVGALAFSPDSRLLASGGAYGIIRLWRLDSGSQGDHLLKTLHGHTRELGALAFSPTGAWLASGDHVGTLCLWDLRRFGEGDDEVGCLVFEQEHRNIVRTLRFSPDGQWLASGSADQTVRLWSLTGQLRWTLTGHTHEVESLAFAEDGRLLASSGFDQKVCLWDTHSGHLLNTLRAHQQNIYRVCFSADGQSFACGGGERILLWQFVRPMCSSVNESAAQSATTTAHLVRTIHSRGQYVNDVSFTPSNRFVISRGANSSVRLWEFATGQATPHLPGNGNHTTTIAYSADGRWLAAAGDDHTIRLWSLASEGYILEQPRCQWSGHTAAVKFLFFSSDGRTLFSSSGDGNVCRWDVESGTKQAVLMDDGHAVEDMALSPDARTLATISWDQSLRLIDTGTGACFAARTTPEVGTRAIAFSPDGEVLAYSGIDLAIYLWRWRTAELPYPLMGHSGVIFSLDFHPTVPLLLSGSSDGTLRLWNVDSRQCTQILRPPGPYAGMNITGVTGISDAQKAALRALGAVEAADDKFPSDKVTSDKVTSDKVTSDKVTSDKVTSDKVNQDYPVTPSPLHPVTPSPLHNLPAALTPLVGREQEMSELAMRLQQPETRLLTLVGAGGMGKSRLALALAHQCKDTYADGAYLVALAPLTSATDIAPAIASVLGLELHAGDPRQALVQYLRNKHMLLILDNFEHLLAGAPLVFELLQSAAKLQILVTSRQRLNVRGEYLYAVDALDLSPAQTPTLAQIPAAVTLLANSAQRVQPTFAVSAHNLPALLRIARLVQGMPLGLELAAAWVEVLAPEEIADEIERGVEFLTADWSDVPDRQRSIAAVFEWSWRLLNESEQQVLRRLAVFRSGFTREAAERVAGASLRVLVSLVHKSLLRPPALNEDQQGCYTMHELLRQFAGRYLAANASDQHATEAQHSQYYLAFVHNREQRLLRNELRSAAAEIQVELDNIRQAWLWAVRHQQAPLLDQSAIGLWQYYVMAGPVREGEQTFAQAVAALQEELRQAKAGTTEVGSRPATLSKLSAIHAFFLVSAGKYAAAAAPAQRAVELGSADERAEGLLLGKMIKGQIAYLTGNYEELRLQMNQVLAQVAHQQQGGYSSEVLYEVEITAHLWLGGSIVGHNQLPQARQQLLQGLQICQRLGKRRAEMVFLNNLANIARHLFDYTTASAEYEQALRIANEIGDRWGASRVQLELGDVECRQGHYSHAHDLLTTALPILQAVGDLPRLGIVLSLLGHLCTNLGNYPQAATWLAEFSQTTKGVDAPETHMQGLIKQSLLAYHTGDFSTALGLIAQATALVQQRGDQLYQAEVLILAGHIQFRLGQMAAAGDAYRQAIALLTAIGDVDWIQEPRAGLLNLALAAGELPQVQSQVEPLVQTLAVRPQLGSIEPFFSDWVAYRALRALNDPRALPLLESAHNHLLACATEIADATERRSFLENVTLHRSLQAAYVASKG